MNEEEIFNLKVGRDKLRECGLEECAVAVEKAIEAINKPIPMESMNKPIPMNPGEALRVQYLALGGLYESWVQIRTVDINTNYEENIREFGYLGYRHWRPPAISLRVDMEVIPGTEVQEMIRADPEFFRRQYPEEENPLGISYFRRSGYQT